MKIFVAASYSSKIDYKTGTVYPEYRTWLEEILNAVQHSGHTVFCALRKDKYCINNLDPAGAFKLDLTRIRESDVLLALLDDTVSGGVQTEIGVAIDAGKIVLLAHRDQDDLIYINNAAVQAGLARELTLPFNNKQLENVLVG